MSAILSADDLNDFINPGVACIKPVETLPKQRPEDTGNPYEVTTEEKLQVSQQPPAQISLTDCLACSGCVTSAEAVLVSLQSHTEVLDTLDRFQERRISRVTGWEEDGAAGGADAKIFVASVSPQTRASIAATYEVSEREAGYMIDQLLSGPYGLRAGGKHGSGFTWVVDTNVMRDVAHVAAADEAQQALETPTHDLKRPVLTSACPGWICYAEKTHPHILPHLSTLKSPQALTGTLIKSVLAKQFGIPPENVWHMAVMPCFDKKLEASRAELTSHTWHGQKDDAIRDVDCVITARELLMLAESRNVRFPRLPRKPLLKNQVPPFPDPTIGRFLFSRRAERQKRLSSKEASNEIGTSGGYLHYILKTQQSRYAYSTLRVQRGRNSDVVEYTLVSPEGKELFRAARYYGFRNIQNLVRRLKPARPNRMPGAARKSGTSRKPVGGAGSSGDGDYAYVEVMACPGGCTNGGGQIKVGDVLTWRQIGGTGIENGTVDQDILPAQKEWLERVDEAYWSAESDSLEEEDRVGGSKTSDITSTNRDGNEGGHEDIINGINRQEINYLLAHWSAVTNIELAKLLCTTYRAVESDVGKNSSQGGDMDKISALSVAAGGGW